jgi:sec-independent protein translocase protein TatC
MSADNASAPSPDTDRPTDTGADGASAEKVMTLVEHLSELRRRIFIAILAIVIGTTVGFFVAPTIIQILAAPIAQPLRFTSPGGAFFLQLKISLIVGIVLASPIVLYELWAFVAPGLTAKERRAARPWVPLAVLFLVLGVGVAYLILPYAIAFLMSWQIPGVVEPLITTDAYFGFVTTLFIAFGLVMQFPILLVLLSKVGIVTAERMRRSRRYVIVGIFIIAVVVTPGGDPISPTIMALVMYPLYELSIYLVSRSSRPRSVAAAEGAEAA